jgi:hypothetical protein
MSNLVNFFDYELILELESRGYFTKNLWKVNDVKSIFNVTDEEAQRVLYTSLTNERIVSEIWDEIDNNGDEFGFERLEL